MVYFVVAVIIDLGQEMNDSIDPFGRQTGQLARSRIAFFRDKLSLTVFPEPEFFGFFSVCPTTRSNFTYWKTE